jgi:hypothetical protein
VQTDRPIADALISVGATRVADLGRGADFLDCLPINVQAMTASVDPPGHYLSMYCSATVKAPNCSTRSD